MQRDYVAISEKYARDVIAGDVLACKWVRLACERYLDDLSWQDDANFAYTFNAERAAHACTFVELMPHTKGKWAAKKQTLIMQPWQVFMTCALFGWLRKSDGTRRFRKFLLLVPRKNGKSAWAAAVGLYMFCAAGEYGAEVYSGATSEKQAWEVFRPAKLMASKSPEMCEAFGVAVNAKNLHVVANESRFEPIIGNPGDGASPFCAIVDEYHEHDTDRLYATMETGQGARDEPLMLVITTAGDNIAGPCYQMQEEAQSMLEGTRKDDEFFALIYTIDAEDDWTEEASLQKANPNFGVSVGAEFLKSQQTQALTSPRKAGIFKTKHLNQWVQARAAYFNVLRYQEAPRVNWSDFEGQDCVVGVDLADKRDLTAVQYLFQPEPGKYAHFGRVYCPEETIELPENEHYRTWREIGRLTEIPGAVTDQRIVKDDIFTDMERFNIREIVFDPWHSRQLGVELAEQGAPVVEFRGSPSNMNEPMRGLEGLIAAGDLMHDGDPAFEWMLSNVVLKNFAAELHRPDKQKAENKIDAPVALIMALGRLLIDDQVAASPWDDPSFSIYGAA